jgi:hypothetical protein
MVLGAVRRRGPDGVLESASVGHAINVAFLAAGAVIAAELRKLLKFYVCSDDILSHASEHS